MIVTETQEFSVLPGSSTHTAQISRRRHILTFSLTNSNYILETMTLVLQKNRKVIFLRHDFHEKWQEKIEDGSSAGKIYFNSSAFLWIQFVKSVEGRYSSQPLPLPASLVPPLPPPPQARGGQAAVGWATGGSKPQVRPARVAVGRSSVESILRAAQ